MPDFGFSSSLGYFRCYYPFCYCVLLRFRRIAVLPCPPGSEGSGSYVNSYNDANIARQSQNCQCTASGYKLLSLKWDFTWNVRLDAVDLGVVKKRQLYQKTLTQKRVSRCCKFSHMNEKRCRTYSISFLPSPVLIGLTSSNLWIVEGVLSLVWHVLNHEILLCRVPKRMGGGAGLLIHKIDKFGDGGRGGRDYRFGVDDIGFGRDEWHHTGLSQVFHEMKRKAS